MLRTRIQEFDSAVVVVVVVVVLVVGGVVVVVTKVVVAGHWYSGQGHPVGQPS